MLSDKKDCLFCAHRFNSILCNADASTLENLQSSKACYQYKKGEHIFKEESLPKGIYCINEGKVKLTILGEHGKEQIVRLAKPGDILGYRAILSGEYLSATATALEPSNICFIPKANFLTAIQSNMNFAMELLKLLSKDIRVADESIVHLAQKNVKERTAEALLILKSTYNYKADGKTLDIKITREDLANIIGTSTETAVRFLTEFKKEQIIDLVGKEILILDEKRLFETADIHH
jgi:CRP/FNR family transcriptional regulator, polysaccharide utilization system transcription regulator